jgi:hypothetical protein
MKGHKRNTIFSQIPHSLFFGKNTSKKLECVAYSRTSIVDIAIFHCDELPTVLVYPRNASGQILRTNLAYRNEASVMRFLIIQGQWEATHIKNALELISPTLVDKM